MRRRDRWCVGCRYATIVYGARVWCTLFESHVLRSCLRRAWEIIRGESFKEEP